MSGGEHSWKRVLFDTNMVSRWMDGDSDFQAPLKALVRRLAKHKATFYVSAVTVQELMVFARASGAHQKAHAFLTSTFTTLELDERAALEAARIGAALPVARGAKQNARDLWHRDIAILGTAAAHEMDAVITCQLAALHFHARRQSRKADHARSRIHFWYLSHRPVSAITQGWRTLGIEEGRSRSVTARARGLMT